MRKGNWILQLLGDLFEMPVSKKCYPTKTTSKSTLIEYFSTVFSISQRVLWVCQIKEINCFIPCHRRNTFFKNNCDAVEVEFLCGKIMYAIVNHCGFDRIYLEIPLIINWHCYVHKTRCERQYKGIFCVYVILIYWARTSV